MSGSGAASARWPELRVVAAATLAGIAFGALLLAAVAQGGHALLADLSGWAPVTNLPSLPDDFVARQQTRVVAQRPFRVTLRLPGTPRDGSFVAVEQGFEVEPGGTYCFDVLLWSESPRRERRRGRASYRAFVAVDGDERVAVPAKPPAGEWLHVPGLAAGGGRMVVRLGLRAEPDRGTRRPSPRAHFEHARFYPCTPRPAETREAGR